MFWRAERDEVPDTLRLAIRATIALTNHWH